MITLSRSTHESSRNLGQPFKVEHYLQDFLGVITKDEKLVRTEGVERVYSYLQK